MRDSQTGDVHTMPNDDTHSSDSFCWCAPEPQECCMECGAIVNPSCWRCDGRGMFQATEMSRGPLIWLHHDVTEDDE